MTGGENETAICRTLCDIAQLLESAQHAEGRVRGVLGLLGGLVPYRQCALLEAEPGCDPRMTAFPDLAGAAASNLTNELVKLFGKMLEEHSLPSEAAPISWGAHLALPLIGLDEVIGILYVRRDDGTYQKDDLRMLSLVAAQLASYLTMLRSRSEEVARVRELEAARRAAESALHAKEELVGLMAHELKTPLAAAMAWVRWLGSSELSPGQRAGALRAIERSVRTQARLVGDLLALSTPAGGRLSLELQSLDPAVSIQAAVDDLRALAAHRSIRLESAVTDSPLPVIADSERLNAILSVLLATAFESTADGGSVQVRLETSDAGARIQVSDSGKGFLPNCLPVFESIGALQDPATRGQKGFGIGLALAKHVVELHGGTIRAESLGQGKGTTFTVDVPRSPVTPRIAN